MSDRVVLGFGAKITGCIILSFATVLYAYYLQLIMKPNGELMGQFYGTNKDIERFGDHPIAPKSIVIFYNPHLLSQGQDKAEIRPPGGITIEGYPGLFYQLKFISSDAQSYEIYKVSLVLSSIGRPNNH